MKKWLDNFGKADNSNESNVSLPEDFVGLSYDTSGRNYSPAWGGQFQQGGSIPDSVGFTYARTAGAAPSEGPYAKKTMPSAQNGREMQFYQEGLDWKPKSMQYGGSEKISTSDPRYPELYKNRQVGAYYDGAFTLPDLPEFTVTGKDESLKEAMYQGSDRFGKNLWALTNAPQEKLMEVITGIQQTPSQAWGFQNIPSVNYSQAYIPYSANPINNPQGSTVNVPASAKDWKNVGKNIGNLTMDMALDPMSLLGTGIIDDLTRGAIRGAAQNTVSNTLKYGVTPYSYSPEVLAMIPENLIRAGLGKPKRLPITVSEVAEKNPNVKRTLEDTYANREDAWSVYLGLPPENKGLRLIGSDEATGLSKYELTKPRLMNSDDIKDYKEIIDRSSIKNNEFKRLNLDKPGDRVVDSDKIFGVMGGYSKFISPDGKSIMYRDVWDLQPFSRLTSKQLPKDMLGNAIRKFEASSLIPGAKPFVSEGKLADIKTKYYPARNYEGIVSRYNRDVDSMTDAYPPEYYIDENDPSSIFQYDQMIRDRVRKNLRNEIEGGKTFLNPTYWKDSRKYADFSPYIRVQKPKKEYGGIIEDNRGQWDHPGEITQVNSNYITMGPDPKTGKKIKNDLIGISDTGDVQYMTPGNDYKFKGSKVTEIPVAELGINQLDAQPKKKLNQLLNFTNNPDKTNWLDNLS